jgi:hypothetical protein
MAQFFYDKQIRRFMIQFVRAFSEFYVEYGRDQDGNTTLYRVPVRYADTNRQVSNILHNNSENTLNTVPIMVVYIDALKYDRDRMQEPTYTEKRQVRERTVDPDTGQYTTGQNQAFTLERLMPVPYRLTLKMEVWTTNFDQKLQILEQILTIFNPDLEIQNTDNYLDWTSLSYILLTDVTWTSRNLPVGTDDPIDIATLTFELPIWITAPAKLKKLGVIQRIVDSVYDSQGNLEQAIINESILTARKQYFTPLGYNVIVLNGQATLVRKYGPVTNTGDLELPSAPGEPINWRPLLSSLGEITNGVTELFLEDEQTSKLVVGTISYHPTDPTILLFNVDQDTIPSNTLSAVASIIEPRKVGPGAGLPIASVGQSYLILQSLGDPRNEQTNQPTAWRNTDGTTTVANANDIIAWDGTRWAVVFDSIQNGEEIQYVTNSYTGIQYKWVGDKWIKSWEGYYNEGLWGVAI